MLDPPSSGTPFIILPGNSWHFMTRHILSMSFDVASPIRPEKPRKFHLCFTLCLLVLYKTLIFNILQEIVRAPFSAQNKSAASAADFVLAGDSNEATPEHAPAFPALFSELEAEAVDFGRVFVAADPDITMGAVDADGFGIFDGRNVVGGQQVEGLG